MAQCYKKTLINYHCGSTSGTWSSTPLSSRLCGSQQPGKQSTQCILYMASSWKLSQVLGTWGLTSPVAYLGTLTLTVLLEMRKELWVTYGEISKQTKVRETAYNTFVRPQLEYAAHIWDPYTKEKTLQLEKIQRRAARWNSSNYDYRSSVTAMLGQLNWRSLEQRRAEACLCLFYKMVNGIVAEPLPDYVHPTH